jgi:hypothetical protein
MQSSEDEGMYASTTPTSAFTSAQTTPERPTSLLTPIDEFQRATPPSRRKAKPNIKDNKCDWGSETIPLQLKHIESRGDGPILFDRPDPVDELPLVSRRTLIPRRIQKKIQKPITESHTIISGFKPIFDLKKGTPTREQIAEHIDFSNNMYVGKYSIGLQRSCLQCVVANLPCDKDWACSRCIRHGQRDMCLTQRDLGIQERLRIGIEEYPYVILVRRHDESDEIWEKKRRLEKKLLNILQERCDRNNWVMPGDRRRMGVCSGKKRFETRAFEVDDIRGRGWKMNIVVGDELRMPI